MNDLRQLINWRVVSPRKDFQQAINWFNVVISTIELRASLPSKDGQGAVVHMP